MARVSTVGTERDRVSTLSAVIRDHRLAMGSSSSSSSRRDQLLGLNSPPDGNAFDEELKEEDVWAAAELSSSTNSATGPLSSPPETSTTTATLLVNSRPGLGGALSRNNGGGGVGRVTSASRMIPHMLASSSHENGRKAMHQSAPVNVPDWSRILGRRSKDNKKKKGVEEMEEGEDEDDDDEEEEVGASGLRLAPHELVARSQVMTFSVFEGAGRTLKGRDLSRVRNAVLKQTGFLQ